MEMAEKEPKIWKTGKIVFGENNFEHVVRVLEYRKKEIEQLVNYIRKLQKNSEKVSNEDIDEMQTWICEIIGNCFECPLVERCEFRFRACEEVNNCESCPRLRICVLEKNAGIREYLKEGE
jgi:hypothetical protein